MLVVIPPVTAAPPTSSFVTRDSGTGNLMLNGSRFRFAGANCANDIGLSGAESIVLVGGVDPYGRTPHSGAYLTTHSQIDALLNSAQAMNATVLRAYGAVMHVNYPDAVQPSIGVFNSAALEPMDYALQQCAVRGIRLIIPLVDEYVGKPWYVSQTGGGGNDQFHTRSATINAFKAHISFVLDHVNPYTAIALRDDPTIMCWETINEGTPSGATGAQLAAWTDTISTYIKTTKGAQQLVMDGGFGITSDGVTFDTARLATTADIHTDHSYDNWRTPAWLTGEANAAHAAGKSFVVGEFSWTGKAVNGSALSWSLTDLLSTIESQTSFDGDCFWDLLAPNTIWGDRFTLHYPPDNTYNGVGLTESTIRGTQLTNHAAAMVPPIFAAAVDGGSADSTGPDTIDGGNAAGTGSDTIDGGSA